MGTELARDSPTLGATTSLHYCELPDVIGGWEMDAQMYAPSHLVPPSTTGSSVLRGRFGAWARWLVVRPDGGSSHGLNLGPASVDALVFV